MRLHPLHPLLALLVAVPVLRTQAPRERLPGWNASFAIPSGWKLVQTSGRAAALTDSAETGAVFVTVAYLATAAAAADELATLFADVHYTPTVTAAPHDTILGGHRATVASYSGAGRTGPILSRAVVVFSDYGTGVTILGLAPAARFPAIAAAVADIAASIEAQLPATNVALVAALRGRWDYEAAASSPDSNAAGSATVRESLDFDGHERFTRAARTIVTIRGGQPVTAASEDDSGTYTVVGATLILRGKAKPRLVDIRLTGDELSVGGRAFRRNPSPS
jgi:hypothetical protein